MPWSALSGTCSQYRSKVVQVEITIKIFFKFLWLESIQIQAGVQLNESLTHPYLPPLPLPTQRPVQDFCPLDSNYLHNQQQLQNHDQHTYINHDTPLHFTQPNFS